MNDQTPATPAAPVSGFVLPTVSPEGQPMTARQQYEHMLQNPDWSRAAVETGTQARQQFDDLNRRMATDAEATDANPTLGLEPARAASEYRLNIDVTAGPEAQAFDGAARSWLHAMGAPSELGSSFVEHVGNVAKRYAGKDEFTLSQLSTKSRQTLERTYGADTDKQIAKVDDFLEAVEKDAPGLAEFLDQNSFLLRDSMVIQYLIQLADARAHRKSAGK